MTIFEHAMLGVTLALATDLPRKSGPSLIALAGVAATIPDWDGLTILLGPRLYADGHRCWGHNLILAPIIGAVLGCIEWRFSVVDKVVARLGRLVPELTKNSAMPATEARLPLWLCMVTGIVASLSHLMADLIYSGSRNTQVWPLKLMWPISDSEWAYPVVPWGDLGTTLLFAVEMFALYRWSSRARVVAWMTLAALVAYGWWLFND